MIAWAFEIFSHAAQNYSGLYVDIRMPKLYFSTILLKVLFSARQPTMIKGVTDERNTAKIN